jgi:hypothetical protein
MNPGKHARDPAGVTRVGITLGLVLGGALAGAVAGVVLTPLGKMVAGAPPADLANFLWNAGAFAAIGAFAAPTVIWSALRHVPLWRAVAEPLMGALMGAAVGALLGSGPAFLLLVPLGAAAAAARLHLSHRARVQVRVASIPGPSTRRPG